MVRSRSSSPSPHRVTPLPWSPSRQRDGATPSLPHQTCRRARASAARVGGGNTNYLGYGEFITLLVGAALLLCATAARAEVLKFMNRCAAQQQLCPSYQLVLTPPDG